MTHPAPSPPTIPAPQTAPSYDLTRQPWIPVLTHDGRTETVGLTELFLRAHELRDLGLPLPAATTALRRVLAVMTYRIAGLDDPDLPVGRWRRQRRAVMDTGRFDPAAVETYFHRHAAGLHLFGDRPFMQDPRLGDPAVCTSTSGVNKLAVTRPAGNNRAWFGHHFDAAPEPLTPAEAVMFLLIHLYFGAAGQMTPRSGHGNGSAGPLRALASYHPIASTLHQTLLLNLVAPVTFTRSTGTGADEAPWEAATLPDPTAPFDVIGPAATLARTPVHAVLLQPAADGVTVVDAIVTWGRDSRLQRAAWETGGVVATSPVILADPFLCRRTNREGAVFAVRADATRAAWRDLDALLLALPDVGAVDLRPRVLAELDDDSLDGAVDDICVEALGIDQDGRSKNTAMMASRTRPVPPMLRARHPRAADAAATSLQRAGTSARRLDIALERVWLREGEGTDGRPANKAVKDQDLSTGWRRDAQQQYWAAAEELFWSHVHLAAIIEAHATLDPDAPEPPGPDPAADYRSLARTIYDRVTAPLATRLPYTRSVARNRP